MYKPYGKKAVEYCTPQSVKEMVESYKLHKSVVNCDIEFGSNDRILLATDQVRKDVLEIRARVFEEREKSTKTTQTSKTTAAKKKKNAPPPLVSIDVVMECALDAMFWNFTSGRRNHRKHSTTTTSSNSSSSSSSDVYSFVLKRLCQVLVHAHLDNDNNYGSSPANDEFFDLCGDMAVLSVTYAENLFPSLLVRLVENLKSQEMTKSNATVQNQLLNTLRGHLMVMLNDLSNVRVTTLAVRAVDMMRRHGLSLFVRNSQQGKQ